VDLQQTRPLKRKITFKVLTDFGYTIQPADSIRRAPNVAPPWWDLKSIDYFVAKGIDTDLASVPPFLWGVIASYGHHTLPAILHDVLCDS
jgi:hypothetical protein